MEFEERRSSGGATEWSCLDQLAKAVKAGSDDFTLAPKVYHACRAKICKTKVYIWGIDSDLMFFCDMLVRIIRPIGFFIVLTPYLLRGQREL